MARRRGHGTSGDLRIDLNALRHNYRWLAERVAPAACAAVTKADAYGLGIGQFAPALYREGCRHFFVAQLCEAFDVLDAIGAQASIYILNGLDPHTEATCAKWGFVPVLNSPSQIDRWRTLARAHGKPLRAALQVDSGMSRLGLEPEMAGELANDPGFAREISLCLLMTHLACADEPEHEANRAQYKRFMAVRHLFPGVPASIANSGGACLGSGFHLDLARPGIALFGGHTGPCADDLRSVIVLEARVLQVRNIDQGTGVGYGLEYVASGQRRLATIGLGYADGWPRSLGGVGAAWFDGHRLPIVGRISMDSFTVDISALPDGTLNEDDFVELIGPSQSVVDVARDAGTISYEILTRLGRRYRRIYVDGSMTEIVAPGGGR